MALGPLLEVNIRDYFLYEWDKVELTLLILNIISKDLLLQDACYGCLF